ncbi:Heat shock cognate protein [Echinococcus granulosus]|uniref:Heat shock cognate protein n=1 Tax=Echinococcus granulosus TaxID=6210 RepID=W6UBL4_ECHGR|nr:Heat shock cognate protein [Echinococcus granulosus]EUB58788.1 Heat shock cognate protein [Echinococcus granulosus]
MSTGTAIGIDLGTSFSCVGVFKHDRVEIVANDQDHRTTPTCVAFTDKEPSDWAHFRRRGSAG